jgi:threonine 3-dehydrogenase
MSAMLRSGLDVSAVITHRFPADQWHEAFATARSGQCGKVVLDWELVS